MWTLAFGHREDRAPTQDVRQPARMRWARFVKSWRGYNRHSYQATASVATMAAKI
jgi:hypothetical protein